MALSLDTLKHTIESTSGLPAPMSADGKLCVGGWLIATRARLGNTIETILLNENPSRPLPAALAPFLNAFMNTKYDARALARAYLEAEQAAL